MVALANRPMRRRLASGRAAKIVHRPGIWGNMGTLPVYFITPCGTRTCEVRRPAKQPVFLRPPIRAAEPAERSAEPGRRGPALPGPVGHPLRAHAKARRLPAFSRQAEPGQGRRPGDPDCPGIRTGTGRRGAGQERAGGPGLGSRNFAGTSGETILIFKGHGPRENRYYVARNQEDIRHARRAHPRMTLCKCARACL